MDKLFFYLVMIFVLILITLTGYSFYTQNVEFIPYIQMIFSLLLLLLGLKEYSVSNRLTYFLVYVFLATISFLAGLFGLLN